jgi:DNA-binding IclR family transcriptional regulator
VFRQAEIVVMAKDVDRQFVESLGRGLAILETLSAARNPLSNGELAKQCGLPASTVSRLTHTLTELGYVRFNRASRGYEPTPKNLMLGYPVLADMPMLELARPHLEQLSRRTGETAALAIRDTLHITFVAVVEGVNLLAVRLAVGGRLRLSVSAAGVALVAALPDEEWRRLIARARAEMSQTDQDPTAFMAALDQCRRDGVAIVRDQWRPGIGGVAVPVFRNGEYAAVTIPVATGAVSERVMRAALADAVKDVAEVLGPAWPVQSPRPRSNAKPHSS